MLVESVQLHRPPGLAPTLAGLDEDVEGHNLPMEVSLVEWPVEDDLVDRLKIRRGEGLGEEAHALVA